ncbi:MAG: biopolymer transporter ExbD [Gammaproteobacteria bacterium]|nr:MAG: biopolymer transporter ExbD [Gammaproteobacteria bacterium]
MKFYRVKKEDVDVNLTPLIDVVFLLLIFFMVSTTFTKESRLNLELPEAQGTPPAAEIKVLELTISSGGRYSVGGASLVNDTREMLSKGLLDVAKGDTAQPLQIVADAQAPLQSVITAMDVAGKLGFVQVSFVTMQPGSQSSK